MINEMREKHRKRLVLGAFKTRLHRLPSVDDIEYWVNFLRIGNTLQDMLNCMKDSSVEVDLANNFIANNNSVLAEESPNELSTANQLNNLLDEFANLTDEDFVDAIYLKLLGRPADVDGKKHLIYSLNQKISRWTLAFNMDISAEASIRKDKLARLTRHQLLSFATVTGDISLSAHASRVYNQFMAAITLQKQEVI